MIGFALTSSPWVQTDHRPPSSVISPNHILFAFFFTQKLPCFCSYFFISDIVPQSGCTALAEKPLGWRLLCLTTCEEDQWITKSSVYRNEYSSCTRFVSVINELAILFISVVTIHSHAVSHIFHWIWCLLLEIRCCCQISEQHRTYSATSLAS